jgi:hypothetical protein
VGVGVGAGLGCAGGGTGAGGGSVCEGGRDAGGRECGDDVGVYIGNPSSTATTSASIESKNERRTYSLENRHPAISCLGVGCVDMTELVGVRLAGAILRKNKGCVSKVVIEIKGRMRRRMTSMTGGQAEGRKEGKGKR